MGIPDLGRVNYDAVLPPHNYRCQKCGIHGVRLWREYNTFVCYNSLTCWDCAEGTDGKGDSVDGFRRGLCAAVPTEEGDTYWGIGSLPAFGFVWWRRLPPTKAELGTGYDARELLALRTALKDTQDMSKMYQDASDMWRTKCADLEDACHVAGVATMVQAEYGQEIQEMEHMYRRSRYERRERKRR